MFSISLSRGSQSSSCYSTHRKCQHVNIHLEWAEDSSRGCPGHLGPCTAYHYSLADRVGRYGLHTKTADTWGSSLRDGSLGIKMLPGTTASHTVLSEFKSQLWPRLQISGRPGRGSQHPELARPSHGHYSIWVGNQWMDISNVEFWALP